MKRPGLFVPILVAFMLCIIPVYARIVVALTPLSGTDGYDRERDVVSQIMQAELTQSTNLTLVDRDQLAQALDELKLAQQGLVPPGATRQLGKIVNARYFCSGSVSKSGDKVMAIVKVIDIETTLTKLAYSFLTSPNDAAEAGKSLAGQVEKLIAQFETDRRVSDKEAVAASPAGAQVIPADWKRPTVMVIIGERHIRQPDVLDPAGETELIKRLLADNFKVIDAEYVHLMKVDQVRARKIFSSLKTATHYAAEKKADLLLYGEAISEGATRLGDFEGCRGRIELKAVDVKTDAILLSDSAEGGATDLAETIAGKKAIQQAANRLADTFLYSLAAKWNSKE